MAPIVKCLILCVCKSTTIFTRSTMKYLIAIASVVVVALAAPQNYYDHYPQTYSGKNVVPIVSESNELNPDGSFSYSYATGDGQQAQAQGYLKNAGNKDQEAEVIQGSYSYTAPDGTPITVTYIADENGFRAEGAHLPTPPPIPEAIRKSLELIAQTQRIQPQQDYQQQTYQRPAYQQPAFQRNPYPYRSRNY